MDMLAVAATIARVNTPKKEPFEDITTNTTTTETTTTSTGKSLSSFMIVMWVLWAVFFVAFGSWAAWLSWDANTVVEWDTIPKSIFAFFAFLGGLTYLFSYLIYKWDLVLGLRACKKPLMPQTQTQSF